MVKGLSTSSLPLHASFDRTKYLEALVLLVCRRKLPFNIVTWPEFESFCLALNPSIKSSLISSRSTLVAHITKVYNFYRNQLRIKLQKAKSLVHLSADLWSSPNRISFIGVHVQWVDETHTVQNMLIGLPECQFSHSGPQQASHIMDLIRWFNIGCNVGFFTGDNAGSNDTCLQAISTALNDEYRVSRLITYFHILLSYGSSALTGLALEFSWYYHNYYHTYCCPTYALFCSSILTYTAANYCYR